MSDVLAQARVWSERGDRVALTTVVQTPKSAPDSAGLEDGDQRAGRGRGRGLRRWRRSRGRGRGRAVARLGGIDRGTFIAILHHDPKLDDAALTAAFQSESPYIGAMGSRRAQDKRRERLEASGVPEHQLKRVSAPIGLDLGALGAEETALSIMAEMVAVRNGHGGGRLSDATGRIHEAV